LAFTIEAAPAAVQSLHRACQPTRPGAGVRRIRTTDAPLRTSQHDRVLAFARADCHSASEQFRAHPMGLPIERDQHFTADDPLSGYAGEADLTGHVITEPARSRPPSRAGGLFHMCVKNRPRRKPQDQRSHPTYGMSTPENRLRCRPDIEITGALVTQ